MKVMVIYLLNKCGPAGRLANIYGAVHKVRHALRGEGGLPKGDISL